MAQDGSGGASTRLERFDGSDPSLYKRWRRRAALMIISLPNTYPAEKYGPKLVEFLSGEAELAVEHIPIEDLAKSGGERLVFKALDERYRSRVGSCFESFTSTTTDQEAMILTATRGSFKVEEVSQAVKAIPANSKGNNKPVQKDTFVADEDTSELTSSSWDEDQEVLQVLAVEMQEQEDYDEEAILDTFESCKQVRTTMQEVRKVRAAIEDPPHLVQVRARRKEVHIVEHDWPEQEDYDVLLNQAADEIELGLNAFMIQGSRERVAVLPGSGAETPLRHSHDGGKFKTKPRAPANTFRYIYTCQKNYTGWVRSHIGEGSSAHLRTFKAYVEMRDAKMMTRLNEVAHQNGRNMNFHSSGIVQGARPQGGASAEYTVQQMVVPPLPIRSPPPQTPSQRSVQSWQVVSAAPCSTYAPPSPSPKMTAGSMGRRRRMRDDDMEVDANRAKKIQDTWTVWTMELMNKNEEAREHVEKETMWLQNSAGGPQKVARMFSRLAVQGTNLQLQEEDQ
ncbi:unnamed protein product [Durusdinium trenchii]|uniref:Uncharacterized protein n=1 Tax=Durusdinium trenchii TaxID=1381693 RepID=A0ABP0RTV8_9DINO